MEHLIKTDELKLIVEKKNLQKNQDILLLDVRRKADYLSEPNIIPGAEWRDPEEIAKWSETVPEDKKVIIYCVKGGSVSKSVSEYLNNRQIKTSYLEGGLKAWQESGGAIQNVK